MKLFFLILSAVYLILVLVRISSTAWLVFCPDGMRAVDNPLAFDKVKLITQRSPAQECLDELNTEYRLRPEERKRFNFSRVLDRYGHGTDNLTLSSEVNVSTKRGVAPQFRIELNYVVPGSNQAPLTTLELNPNKLDDGWRGVRAVVDWLFPRDCPDLKVSRLDVNAEAEGVSVDYLKEVMRVPGKRKSEEMGEVWKDKGVTGFRIGKRPAFLRVYNKLEEMRYRGETWEADRFPEVLSRVEWELHGRLITNMMGLAKRRVPTLLDDGKPPFLHFSEIEMLEEVRPFDRVEFLKLDEHYDFRNDIKNSVHRVTVSALIERLDAHDAVRVLNYARNFNRDYRPLFTNDLDLKQQLQESYAKSIRRLFSGKGADVKHIYLHCWWCALRGIDVHPCRGCGVRLCDGCRELVEGHESDCPIRKEALN